jgi:flagellar motor protein MotB
MAKKKQIIDDGDDVPAWIVSFSDMVTLLLAFFVLLQAFATTKSPDLFYAGQGSFQRAIHGLGIPNITLGKKQDTQQDWRQIKYPTEQSDDYIEEAPRDFQEQKIRELFNHLRQDSFKTEAENLRARVRNLYPTLVRFRQDSPVLSIEDAKQIVQISKKLKETAIDSSTKVYVFGYAPDIADKDRRWEVATRRAQAVESLLRQSLAQQLHAEDWIRSIGGGPDNVLTRGFNTDPDNQQIVIAVIEE